MRAALLALAAVLVAGGALADWDRSTRQFTDKYDPQRLDYLLSELKDARARGMTDAEVAQYVSALVDRRLSSTNKISWSGRDNYGIVYVNSVWAQRMERFDSERGAYDDQPNRINTGHSYADRAAWSWEIRYGNCNEAMNVTYHVMKELGIPARMFESGGGGHNFTIINMAPDADLTNPFTWGPDALVVDGWLGTSMTPAEAFRHKNVLGAGRNKMSDVTEIYDAPAQHQRWLEMAGKGQLKVYVSEKAEPSKRVGGASIAVTGPAGNQSAPTDANGLASFDLPVGSYSVTASAKKFASASGSANLGERLIAIVQLALAKDDAPEDLEKGLEKIDALIRDCEQEEALVLANDLGARFPNEPSWQQWSGASLAGLRTDAQTQHDARTHLRSGKEAIERKDVDGAVAALRQAMGVAGVPSCLIDQMRGLLTELERRQTFSRLTKEVAEASNDRCDFKAAEQKVGEIAQIQPRDPEIADWLDQEVPKLGDLKRRETEAMQLLRDARAAAQQPDPDWDAIVVVLQRALDVAPSCVRTREGIEQLLVDARRQKQVEPDSSIVLLIDTSGSMGDNDKIGQAKRAAQTAARKASKSTEMAVFQFDGGCDAGAVRVVHDFSTDANSLMQSIDSLAPGGGTPMYIAVGVTVEALKQRRARTRAVVLLSDGGDSCRDGMANAAAGIRTSNIPVNTIGFDVGTNQQAQDDLTGLSTMTHGRSVSASASDPREIIRAFDLALLPNLLKDLDASAVVAGGVAPPAALKGYFDAAKARVTQNDLDGALFQFQQASRVAPDVSAVHFNLSLLYESQDQLLGAMKHAGEYLRLAPQAFDRGDVENRIANLQADLEKNPRVQYDTAACRDLYRWAQKEQDAAKKARNVSRRQAILELLIAAQRGECERARTLEAAYRQAFAK